jgi:hypothetical protein
MIPAAEIMELARQEYIFAELPGDSCLGLSCNVVCPHMSVTLAKTVDFLATLI